MSLVKLLSLSILMKVEYYIICVQVDLMSEAMGCIFQIEKERVGNLVRFHGVM